MKYRILILQDTPVGSITKCVLEADSLELTNVIELLKSSINKKEKIEILIKEA